MTQTDLWKALEETQLYISKYYATALTDEDKHDQLKAYIEKFVLDNGYLVDGFTDEELVNRLYSEMVEYSILTPYLGAPDIDEINVNAWDDVVLTYSDGRMVKTEEHFHSPGHAVDIVKVIVHIPVYRKVRNHVHLRVVQLSDLRQVYAGPVCLYTVFEHIVHVLQE